MQLCVRVPYCNIFGVFDNKERRLFAQLLYLLASRPIIWKMKWKYVCDDNDQRGQPLTTFDEIIKDLILSKVFFSWVAANQRDYYTLKDSSQQIKKAFTTMSSYLERYIVRIHAPKPIVVIYDAYSTNL